MDSETATFCAHAVIDADIASEPQFQYSALTEGGRSCGLDGLC